MKVIGTILCKVEKDDIIDDKLIIPETIEYIENYAFYGCTTLKEVTISKSIKIISPFIFGYCDSLEKINFESSIFYINSAEGISGFFDLKNLKSINIYDEELKASNNLMDDFKNEEKYKEIIKREVFNKIFKEVGLFATNVEKNELERACRTSKLMLDYLDKILYHILNIKEYDYQKNINLLVTKIIESYFGINESSNNQVLIMKS